MAKKIKMQDGQQQHQTTHQSEERSSNERQKEFSHQNQQSHHHPHHHHHSHHNTVLQHSSSPHHTAVDTKPKLPIITTMTTVSGDAIKTTSLTHMTTTSPPHEVSLQAANAIESRALTTSHALSSGAETIENSLHIPITAADVANLVLVSSKNSILQA